MNLFPTPSTPQALPKERLLSLSFTALPKERLPVPYFDRRHLVFGGLLAAASTTSSGAAHAREKSAPTPYELGFQQPYGLTAENRIRGCDGRINSNCVSSSSFSEAYSPPWTAPVPANEAMEEFDSALLGTVPAAELVESLQTASGGFYRRYKMPSAFEFDIVEVLIAPQQAPYESEPPMVTYRSQAGTVKFIWPVTQPISDGGAQRKRMTAIRSKLGWRIMGGDCDLIECFKD